MDQYQKAQKWKRAEFVAQQIKDFESDPEVKNTLLMLDWKKIKFEINGEEVLVDDELLIEALELSDKSEETDEFKPANLGYQKNWVRHNFIDFLDALDNFGYFLEAKLVTKEELHPG